VNDDEIGFEKGVVLTVLEKKLDGWWRVQYQGKEGWTPGSYLKRMEIQVFEPSGLLEGIVDVTGGDKGAGKTKPKKPRQKAAAAADVDVANVKLRPKDATKPPPRRESISRVSSIHGDKGAFAKIIAARVRLSQTTLFLACADRPFSLCALPSSPHPPLPSSGQRGASEKFARRGTEVARAGP
jgi:hypothetical protein